MQYVSHSDRLPPHVFSLKPYTRSLAHLPVPHFKKMVWFNNGKIVCLICLPCWCRQGLSRTEGQSETQESAQIRADIFSRAEGPEVVHTELLVRLAKAVVSSYIVFVGEITRSCQRLASQKL